MRKFVWMVAVLTMVAVMGMSSGCGGKDKEKEGKHEKTASEKDKEKMEGTWQVTAMEMGGIEAPKDMVEKGKPLMIFSGDKVTMDMPAGPKERKKDEGTFTIDASKEPKTITMTPTKESKDQKVMKGIYKFDGDTLIICGTEEKDAPKEFKSPKDSKVMMLTLKKEKK